MNRKFLRVSALVIAGLMSVSMLLTGCAKKTPEVSSTTSKATTVAPKEELKPVTLNWVTRCNPQTDYASVETEMNKILQAKLNTTLKINFIDTGSFDQKAKIMLAAGEDVDIMFTSNFANDYETGVGKGAFLAIDELLAKYAPKSYAAVPKSFWDAVKIGGKTYGFINYQIVARQIGAIAQTAMLDKYKFDLTKVKKLEDFEPFLDQLQKGEPDKVVMEMYKDGMWVLLNTYYGIEQIGAASSPGVVDIADSTAKLYNQYESPKFKEHVTLMNKWYNKGFFVKDAATFTAILDQRKTGKILTAINPIKPGVEGDLKVNYSSEMKVQSIDQPFVTTSAVISTMNAIPKVSKNPERAMMLLELVNTDKAFNTLLNMGIENKHYKMTGANSAELIKDSGYAPNRAWTFSTQFLIPTLPGQLADVWDQTKKMNETAVVSKVLGFSFNAEPVISEIAQCSSAIAEFGPGLWTGTLDVEKYLPQLIAKLKAGGSEKIIAEKQKQLDAWKAANKK